ncbi:Dipeptide transport ATP-binding protein DppD [Lentibacillus sp. JNUCC-1]|uniref:ABC transporter ATP-binding protein n=1 Tax=Lentibacillus sp. JNUCC-1 TaxID=2654513 RepID=UPI0012E91D03|nr:ABC transporter ATP-binding protein [Lentibacillus sp. JNUCC-1]MUV38789.1 Dipeptide transport ATP-binding protein DppD [Lentibacillus sp. JNUCC-1]
MNKVLEVNDLSISFDTHNGEVEAVRGITFDLYEKETLAIVGESGSGKSVTAQSIMKLISTPPARYKSGSIVYKGENLISKSEKEMEKYRGKEIGMIFQDPMTSLNPTMRIGKQIMEGLLKNEMISRKEAKKRTIELLEMAGIPNATDRVDNYPHQFSGGMRQRVVIAIALASNPNILIADEPTTALDVTIQAQILELMKNIQEKTNNSIIFITHDMGVVANVADRVAVMYAGKIIEIGRTDEIFYNAKHPYTWGLLGSIPTPNMEKGDLVSIPGSPPNMLKPPVGDAFAPRNAYALKIDTKQEPPMFKVSDTHYAATWLLHENSPKVEPPEEVKKRMKGISSKQKIGDEK